MSERQLFTFEIASNGCFLMFILMRYIVECRQHKHDNQSYDISKSRSLAISTNKILKVLKPIPEEHIK